MKKLFYSLSVITLAVISGYVINGAVTAPKEKKGVVTQVKEELGRWKFDWQQRGKTPAERQRGYTEYKEHGRVLTPKERMEQSMARGAEAAGTLQEMRLQPRVIAPTAAARSGDSIIEEARAVRSVDYSSLGGAPARPTTTTAAPRTTVRTTTTVQPRQGKLARLEQRTAEMAERSRALREAAEAGTLGRRQ